MNDDALLSWEKPLVLVEHECQTRLHEPARSGLMILIASLLIHLAVLVVIYIWLPKELPRLIVPLLISTFLMPTFHFFSMRGICLNRERHYELREDGVLYQWYQGKVLYRWQRLRCYVIKEHPVLPSIRIVDIEGRNRWKGCQLTFDANEVAEETIISLLQTKLKS
jgi:hypothetical protein